MRVWIYVLLLVYALPSGAQNGQSHPSRKKDLVRYDSSQLPGSDSGAFVRINRIFVIGNKITREQIILRELTLKTGDIVFNEDLPAILETDRRKIYNTRLFNTVEVKPLELEQNQTDILIDVSERWYTFPVPIFELSDRNFNEWWQNYKHDFSRVNYGLRLYQYNFRGRNETIRATFQFGYSRIFSLSYQIPYIDTKQKQGLTFEFDFREAKNLAYQTTDHKLDYFEDRNLLRTSRGVGISYTYRNSFYDVHTLKTEYRTTEVADTITQLNPYYFRNDQNKQTYMAVHYRFSSDHRDVIAYPLRGRYFFAGISRYGFGKNQDINKTEILMGYARHFDLGNTLYFSNYSYASWSSPDEQPYNMLSALGYSKQIVRGYEIYVIEGPWYALNKSTLKKRIFSRKYKVQKLFADQFSYVPLDIYVKGYADFGYAENYNRYASAGLNTTLSNQLLLGVGSGLDIVTSYDTVIRLEYTFNNEGRGGFYLNFKKEF